jgi:integrase
MVKKQQQTTKYPGVYIDEKGKFFYQSEFGLDRITGKRIRKKGRKDLNGTPFSSASEANKELTRLKREYHKVNSYANYKMNYAQFMNEVYIPYYKTEIRESTFAVREKTLETMRDKFQSIPLRSLSIENVQSYRTWLLTDKDNGGAGYSQSYASLVFGMFRKSLDKAVEMQYLKYNIAKKVKAIPKGKVNVPYWTKCDFEKVISQIFIGDFYEHLNLVMLWVYFSTGIRVNEGTGLWWSDIDFEKKNMKVHHMLVIQSKNKWKRNNYTKTADGMRTIALDSDTLEILINWKYRQTEIGLGKNDGFIFSYDGFPMIKSTIGRILIRYAKLAGVKKIQAKGLRHSHASYLINEFNVSILVLSQRMGHSSPEITLKHYAHMWSSADVAIAKKMGGNLKLESASKTRISFNGNQTIKK